MYRIIDSRSTGKTSRLLLLAKENNGVVVCLNPKKTQEKAYAYGLIGIDYVSYIDYINNPDEVGNKPIYIDDLECFMACFTKNNLSGYTISED